MTDFKPQTANANEHTERGMAALEGSIATDGWIGALTVAADGEAFDGSARLEIGPGFDDPIIVQSDGTRPIVHIRTDIPTASDPRAVRLGLAANRVAELNLSWSADVLASLDVDLSGLWTDDELALVMPEPIEGAGGDDFDTTPDEGPTRVQPGELWQLGRHVIACLDSTDADAVRRVVGTEKVGMVWADPPYGIAIVSTNGCVGGGAEYDIPFGGRKTKRLGSTDTAKPFGKVGTISRGMKATPITEQGLYPPVIGDDSTVTAIASFNACREICPSALHVWWGANHYADALPSSSCWIVWDKENSDSFFADAELAWCSDKSAVRIFRHMWNGLMKASERGERRVHPTQKPVALAVWAFEKYGKEGDLILDPFLGSGISIIAAERTGRRVVGFELSPAYCDVILKRFTAETGIEPERIDG